MAEAGLPPAIDACLVQAAAHYAVAPAQVRDYLRARDGRTGVLRTLPDGSYEVGLARLRQADVQAVLTGEITVERLRTDDCLNVALAAYVVASAARQAASAPARVVWTLDRCVTNAARHYGVPELPFRAVLAAEGGRPGDKRPNSNGSFDFGRAQINSIHLPTLAQWGIREGDLRWNDCLNVHIAAWRLRLEIDRVGDLWRGIGNYHSRTPGLNAKYQQRVRAHLARIAGTPRGGDA